MDDYVGEDDDEDNHIFHNRSFSPNRLFLGTKEEGHTFQIGRPTLQPIGGDCSPTRKFSNSCNKGDCIEKHSTKLVGSSSKKLLSKLWTKILRQKEMKISSGNIDYPVTEENDRIDSSRKVKKPSVHTTATASASHLLSEVVKGVPTLLDLHTAQLKHG